MSIFKIKQWWHNENLLEDKFDEGTQNASSVKVDRFISHSESDCIIVGQGSEIKIYKPNIEVNTSPIILESQLSDIILQIGTGKFTMDARDRQVIVLHPKSFAIYSLSRKEGHVDLGDQNALELVIKHSFNRKACCVICGPFGYSKSRDFICVQALDGTLSFFDQDTFLFMCLYNDVIIPGPICYVPSSDLFVLCKSSWILETYSYQQLGEFSELSVRTSKKNIPQWSYNAGEEIMALQVIRSSSNFCSIIALGERHIYCFQDNGLMKFMIRFDFLPTCFHAYLIGWYYEPNARLLIMVASEESKLYIYEGSSLLWSSDLLHKAISISRCYLKSLSGGIVTLSTNGIVNVSFLGTEPDLNSNSSSMHEVVDPQQIQKELESVEESLQTIMDSQEESSDHFSMIDKILQIKADIGKPINNGHYNLAEDKILSICSIVVMLTCTEPKLIQSVQITYDSYLPIACTETTVCLENMNGTEIIETGVFISGDYHIHNSNVNILFTIIDCAGKITTISKCILLPLNLYCLLSGVDAESQSDVMLTVTCSHPCPEFSDIFTDFTKDELYNYINSNAITFAYRTTDKTVTIKSSENIVIFVAEDFGDIYAILIYVLNNLKNHYHRIGILDFKTNVGISAELYKHITQKFLKCVENHAKKRVLQKNLENELNVLQRQFTLVQKRLLVQYGSSPPGDCQPLEFLMRDTHDRITKTAKELLLNKQQVCGAGNTLCAVGNLLTHILKQISPDDFNIKLTEEMLSLNTLSEQFQEWEEAVFQASSYFIKKVLKKSEKDKEKLALVTDQDILSHNNLKKFLKQLRVILERVYSDTSASVKENITRIEEIVEVI